MTNKLNFTQKKLNEISSLPQMDAAMSEWRQQIILVVITQVNNEGDITDNRRTINFDGVVQPLQPEEIKLKPEGQRHWEWLQIHSYAGDLNLSTNDRVEYKGMPFKIMATKDYSEYNYIEYHLVRDTTVAA